MSFERPGRNSQNFIHVRHRDEVEAPITDWLQEAYELSAVLAAKNESRRLEPKRGPIKKKPRGRRGARKRRTGAGTCRPRVLTVAARLVY